MVDFWNDPQILAAGNVRRLPGGDPDAHGASITRTPATEPPIYIPELATLSGDLNAHAERLGIPVEQIVAARAGTGRTLLDTIADAFRKRFNR
jgi:hypothetical protein